MASEVTTLDCADLGITDLTGLETLTELTSLNLANNDLVDIQALESLSNLTSLDLTGNEAIACGDLDSLDTQLGQGVLTRPIACAGGSGISNQRVQNLHNAMGQRAVKSVDGGAAGTIHFIYDQAGQVIVEIEAATGITLREYIYVNGVQVALVDDTGTQDEAVYFVHADHLATPQKITDSAQAVVWSGSYEPFGEVEETVNLVENNIRFPGQYADGETGLHYNYFRDYDPSLGRYVESDPIGLVGGFNTFAYVGSNPLTRIDPTGKLFFFIAPAVPSFGGAVGGFLVGSGVAAGMAAAGSAIGGMISDLFDSDEGCDEQERCKKVRDGCIPGCAHFVYHKPKRSRVGGFAGDDFGFCVAECMRRNGC